MTECSQEVPLFPLHTVLFPGGPVSLRIIEPRYLAMVSRCLKQKIGFGVVLISPGSGAGSVGLEHMGTLARIHDWGPLKDGLLGVTALGEKRFWIESMEEAKDGLTLAEVKPVPEKEAVQLPGRYRHLAQILAQLLPQLPRPWRLVTPAMNDAAWVGCRLAELLPVSPVEKQRLLEMDDPVQRLAEIGDYFEAT